MHLTVTQEPIAHGESNWELEGVKGKAGGRDGGYVAISKQRQERQGQGSKGRQKEQEYQDTVNARERNG